jgi:hypothetical protein
VSECGFLGFASCTFLFLRKINIKISRTKASGFNGLCVWRQERFSHENENNIVSCCMYVQEGKESLHQLCMIMASERDEEKCSWHARQSTLLSRLRWEFVVIFFSFNELEQNKISKRKKSSKFPSHNYHVFEFNFLLQLEHSMRKEQQRQRECSKLMMKYAAVAAIATAHFH